MRGVVTRVARARVTVEGKTVGAIEQGLLVLVGVRRGDSPEQAEKLADRICGLRIFEDEAGKMNRSLGDVGGALLLVSQFTLYADTRSRRPGFTEAAGSAEALPLFQRVIDCCRERGFPVETGVFGAHMEVESLNDGPVTILLEV